MDRFTLAKVPTAHLRSDTIAFSWLFFLLTVKQVFYIALLHQNHEQSSASFKLKSVGAHCNRKVSSWPMVAACPIDINVWVWWTALIAKPYLWSLKLQHYNAKLLGHGMRKVKPICPRKHGLSALWQLDMESSVLNLIHFEEFIQMLSVERKTFCRHWIVMHIAGSF